MKTHWSVVMTFR